jgi:hypothetical protein
MTRSYEIGKDDPVIIIEQLEEEIEQLQAELAKVKVNLGFAKMSEKTQIAEIERLKERLIQADLDIIRLVKEKDNEQKH